MVTLKMVIDARRRAEKLMKSSNKSDFMKAFNYLNKKKEFRHYLENDGQILKPKNVTEMKKLINDSITKMSEDIVVNAVQTGNTVIASVYGKDMKKSNVDIMKLIGANAEKLAKTQKDVERKSTLSEVEKAYINAHQKKGVTGLGDDDIINVLINRNIKNQKELNSLMKEFQTLDHKVIREGISKGFTEDIKINYFKTINITKAKELEKWQKLCERLDYKGILKVEHYLTNVLPTEHPSDSIDIQENSDFTQLMNERLRQVTEFTKDYLKVNKL